MIKQQIQDLLKQQKVTSISDVICFVIEQVTKTLNQEPMEQIYFRLSQLEKETGLDAIMIEQVKAIVQAMMDQRQENLRCDIERNMTEKYENIEHIIANMNNNTKKTRQSLAEVDIINFLSTNSFNGGYQDQYRKNRQSFKENFSQSLTRGNILSDCNKIKQKIQTDKKEVNDLKYSLIQINRQMSNKLSIQQCHSIVSEFEGRMYQKIQNQKLELQKLEFKVKRQFQDELLKIRKEMLVDIDFEGLRKELSVHKKVSEKMSEKIEKVTEKIEKATEKIEKKLQKVNKYRQETKLLSKNCRDLQICQQSVQKQLKNQTQKFLQYCAFNDTKNQDLCKVLDEINQKLEYFQKIDTMQKKVNEVHLANAKGEWATQCKTKNEKIVWEKQILNSYPNVFKFQNQKSQIVIYQPSVYTLEFSLLEIKLNYLQGTIFISTFGLNSNTREINVSGNTILKSLVQITQKSSISIKVAGRQNNLESKGNGILKICKY